MNALLLLVKRQDRSRKPPLFFRPYLYGLLFMLLCRSFTGFAQSPCTSCNQGFSNGDFSSPVCNNNVFSSMNYVPCTSIANTSLQPGEYTVASDASYWDHTWSAYDNFIPGGRFLLGHGPELFAPDSMQVAWKQLVPVMQDSTYCFSAYVKNVDSMGITRPNFGLYMNGLMGAQLNTLYQLDFGSGWVKMNNTFTATSTGMIELDLVVFKQAGMGNHFAADNFSFLVKPKKPDARFIWDPDFACHTPVRMLPRDSVDCQYWDFGDGTHSSDPHPIKEFDSTGEYLIKHIVYNCCDTDTASFLVRIICPLDCDGCDSNAIYNGDMELNLLCQYNFFGSDFLPTCFDSAHPSLGNGHYSITTNASNWNPNWIAKEYYTGSGFRNFMIGDGFHNLTATAWHAEELVDSGRTYCICAMVRNMCKTCNPAENPSFDFRKDSPTGQLLTGIDKVPFDPIPTNWKKMCGRFKATANYVDIYLNNLACPSENGNDFAIDNIEMRAIDKPSADWHAIPGGHCNSPQQFIVNNSTGGGNYKWTFGDGTGSATRNPLHTYAAPGSYSVTLILSNYCGADTVTKVVKIGRCCGCDSCHLSNIISNGDFADTICAHNTFNTGLIAACGNYAFLGHNHYTLTAASEAYNPGWSAPDHSPGGNTGVLLCDGPNELNGDSVLAWQQKKNLVKNHKYCFIAWVRNACNKTECVKPGFELYVTFDGQPAKIKLDAIDSVDAASGWTKMCGTYKATSNQLTNFNIYVYGRDGAGNDFALDDIALFDVSRPDSSFVITGTLKCNEQLTFTPNANPSDPQYHHSWDFDDYSTSDSAQPHHIYPAAGTYTIRHIISDNCGSDTSYITITVAPCDCSCHGCDSAYAEKVINGDFRENTNNGYVHFQSDVTVNFNHSVPMVGHITVTNDASTWNTNWDAYDHTPDSTTKFILGDAVGTYSYWKQKQHVGDGVYYCFSAWVKNVKTNGGYDPSFRLKINGANGIVIGARDTLSYDQGWVKMCGYYLAKDKDMTQDSVTLCVVVNSGPGEGNDFAIDDISFRPISCDTCVCYYGAILGAQSTREEQNGISYYPVPIQQGHRLTMEFYTRESEEMKASVFDMSGRVVLQKNWNTEKGQNHASIETHELSEGVYIIKVESNHIRQARRIVISR